MSPRSFMLIAGEASGDLLGAELVIALRRELKALPGSSTGSTKSEVEALGPRFFGAGGPRMAAAGVELLEDMTRHSVIGLWEALRQLRVFRTLFKRFLQAACERQPDVIICVDFAGFNRRFATAVRRQMHRQQQHGFNNWRPRLVQFVSPQVWASRPTRAFSMAADLDLLLVTFPFEQDWYARRFPSLPVHFVGNPALERHGETPRSRPLPNSEKPNIVLLPGSRAGELRRHLPVISDTVRLIQDQKPAAQFTLVATNQELEAMVHGFPGFPAAVQATVGPVGDALRRADLAITKSGTITLECALFGVPAVVFYRTSWPTYLLGRMVVGVDYLSMPNLLAGRELYPEFVQHAATPENLARTGLALLNDPGKLEVMRLALARLVEPLRKAGASRRAARAILELLS